MEKYHRFKICFTFYHHQATFRNPISKITRRTSGLLKFLRNPPYAAAHCHVMRWVTEKENCHQWRGFPKGMPGHKLGMEPLSLRRSPVRNEKGERRKKSAGHRC